VSSLRDRVDLLMSANERAPDPLGRS
jgi:hypothetical protein